MAWKSREHKEPPPQFFADVVAYLHRAYPNASLSRIRLEELKPFLIAEWRQGQNAHDAAKATCACDGREILPSPATGVFLPKHAVRPPPGALRGTVYGLDELREPSRLAKLRVGVALAERKAEYEEGKAAQVEAKRQTARSDGAKLRLQSQLDRAREAALAHRAEEKRLREQLQAALAQAGWTRPERDTPPRTPHRSPVRKPRAVDPKWASPSPAKPAQGDKKGCRGCAEKQEAIPMPAEVLTDEAAEQLVNQFAAAAVLDKKRAEPKERRKRCSAS